MEKEKYVRPAAKSTEVEIGVYGEYCPDGGTWDDNLRECLY